MTAPQEAMSKTEYEVALLRLGAEAQKDITEIVLSRA